MAYLQTTDVVSVAPVGRHIQDDDFDHIMWIMRNSDRPFAEFEARIDEALQRTTFTAQMAAMEDSLNVDAAKLPSAILAKWEQLILRIAETTVFGQCAPLER